MDNELTKNLLSKKSTLTGYGELLKVFGLLRDPFINNNGKTIYFITNELVAFFLGDLWGEAFRGSFYKDD